MVRSTRRFARGSGETEDEEAPEEPGELREEGKRGEVQEKGKGKGRKVKKKKPGKSKTQKLQKAKQKKQEGKPKEAIVENRDEGGRGTSGRERERGKPTTKGTENRKIGQR